MDSNKRRSPEMLQAFNEAFRSSFDSAQIENLNRILESANSAFSEFCNSAFEPLQQTLSATNQLSSLYDSIRESTSALVGSYSKIAETLLASFQIPDFSSLAENITVRDDYVELNGKAVEILSPYIALPAAEEPSTDLPSDHPAPAKCKMDRMQLFNLLLAILAIVLPMMQAQINETINSAEQQQQWTIENEQREELINLQKNENAQNEKIIELFEQFLELQKADLEDPKPACPQCPVRQELPTVHDQVSESDDPTPSPADDGQTVPDESYAPDTDEQ